MVPLQVLVIGWCLYTTAQGFTFGFTASNFPLLPSMPMFKFTGWDIPCYFSTFFVVFTPLLGIYSVFWALYTFSVSSHLSLERCIFLHVFLRQPASLRALTSSEAVNKKWNQIYAVIFILVLLMLFSHSIEIFDLFFS